MKTLGIDLGGTKIEAQIFDANFRQEQTRRIVTPRDYSDLVEAMADLIRWARTAFGVQGIGVSAAGLVDQVSGKAFAANLPVSGQAFPADLAQAAGCHVTYLNDCHALALSEAVLGAGKGKRRVAAVVLGTGVGGGVVQDGRIVRGASGLAGEIGHTSAPAAWHDCFGIPVVACGCGRKGCIETYLSGPGLVRLGQVMLGQQCDAPRIIAGRADETRPVWAAWCDLGAELLRNLVLMHDPDIIVLGGGLSEAAGVADILSAELADRAIGGFAMPPVVPAEGGPTSGGRGAAYAARRQALDHGEEA